MYDAIVLNGDYFGSSKIQLDFPCEIHFSRFGDSQRRSRNTSKAIYEKIRFISSDCFKVFVCSNEPSTSDNRETAFNIIHNSYAYDLILTSQKIIIDSCPNAVFFPYGTTWLNKDSIHIDSLGEFDASLLELTSDKVFNVSFITTNRRYKDGYELRYLIWNNRDKIKIPTVFYSSTRAITNDGSYSDTIHNGLLPNDDKIHLFKSQFSIAIESTKEDSYFSEKLIDCLLTKTVPIYWGAPDIGNFFNTKGMIIVDDYNDLISKINQIDESTYDAMKPYIDENFEKAKEYGRLFFSRIADKIKLKYEEQSKKNDILWTVAILTIPERKQKLKTLIDFLSKTVPFRFSKRIELLVNEDKKEKSIGVKRQEILDKANGKYVSFIDDDDYVSPSYISKIADLLDLEIYDGVGFYGKYFYNGIPRMYFHHLNANGLDHKSVDEKIQFRPLNHLNPVRLNIARQVGYSDLNYAEDFEYSQKLYKSNLILSESNIDEVLYYYMYFDK